MNTQQVIDLLLAMNISGLTNAKIDEIKGNVLILESEIRAEKNGENKSLLNAKISLMYSLSYKVQRKTKKSSRR